MSGFFVVAVAVFLRLG